MRLIDTLQQRLSSEPSLFRAQLMREDIARLNKLVALVGSSTDLAAFQRAGLQIGWTQGDSRTQEIREPLLNFLEAFYALERNSHTVDHEARVETTWRIVEHARLEHLVGCLSTRLPKPTD